LIQKPHDNLIVAWVYFLEVTGIQLQFKDVQQIEEALEYFEQKNFGSTMRTGVTLEHYWQAWYERLPKGTHNHKTKLKVSAALRSMLVEISNGTLKDKLA